MSSNLLKSIVHVLCAHAFRWSGMKLALADTKANPGMRDLDGQLSDLLVILSFTNRCRLSAVCFLENRLRHFTKREMRHTQNHDDIARHRCRSSDTSPTHASRPPRRWTNICVIANNVDLCYYCPFSRRDATRCNGIRIEKASVALSHTKVSFANSLAEIRMITALNYSMYGQMGKIEHSFVMLFRSECADT